MTSLSDPPCKERQQQPTPCDLRLGHESDLALCAELERLADELPRLPPPETLRLLGDRLLKAGERWCDPEARRQLAGTPAWDARIADAMHAEDLVAALWRHWRRPDDLSTGQLSYMLRALFDGRRRGIALEEAWLGCADCQSSAID